MDVVTRRMFRLILNSPLHMWMRSVGSALLLLAYLYDSAENQLHKHDRFYNVFAPVKERRDSLLKKFSTFFKRKHIEA